MKYSLNKLIIQLCLVLAAFLFFESAVGSYRLTLKFEAPVSGEMEVFWRTKYAGYSQDKSKRVPAVAGMQEISLMIPAAGLAALRFDPGDSSGIYKINTIRLDSMIFSIDWEGTELSKIKSHTGGTEAEFRNGELLVSNPKADPGVEISPIRLDDIFLLSTSAVSLFLALFLFSRKQDEAEELSTGALVGGAALLFSMLVIFKIHGSSIDMLGESLKVPERASILGQAKAVRSDEWLVATPSLLAQVNQTPSFPVENVSLGSAQAPLLFGLPVRHAGAILRPTLWGFFFLDAERAYSFWWNAKLFSSLVGLFLFLQLLNGGRTWQSLSLSLLFGYSSYSQWWQSTNLPELIGSSSLAAFFLIKSASAASGGGRLAYLVPAVLAACWFICTPYPPFQVPICWAFFLAFLYLWHTSGYRVKRGVVLTFIFFTLSSCALSALYLFDLKESLMILSETSYPGRRLSLGGGLSLSDIFRGFFAPLWNQDVYPAKYGNVCEASSFLLFSPLLLVSLLFYGKDGLKRFLPLAFFIFGILAITLFMIAGFPRPVSLLSGFSMVPSNRAFVGLGLLDIFLLAAYLKIRPGLGIFTALISLAVWMAYMLFLNFPEPFPYYVWGFLALAALSGLSLIGKRFYAAPLLTVSLAAHLLTNPISRGLGPLLESDAFEFGREIEARYKDEKMVVLNDITYSRVLAAAGVDVISGTRFIPDLEIFFKLDEKHEHENSYNRYAHVIYTESSGAPEFEVLQPDVIRVKLDPCRDLPAVGVKYVVKREEDPAPLLERCASRVELPESEESGLELLSLRGDSNINGR